MAVQCCITAVANEDTHYVVLVSSVLLLSTVGWILLSFLQNMFLSVVFIASRTGLSSTMATSGVAMP